MDAFGPTPARDLVGLAGTSAADAHYTLAPEFFAGVTYPNTMVYVDACSSAAPVAPDRAAQGKTARRLGDVFMENGAGAYLGWESPVNAALATRATAYLFDKLAPTVTNVNSITITATPPNPGVDVPYVLQATVDPPQAGVQVQLTVRGTDGFARDEPLSGEALKVTDASGIVTFSEITGAKTAGVVDTITVSAGGAANTATAAEIVKTNPELVPYKLAWMNKVTSTAKLAVDDRSKASFNLVCANQKLTQMTKVVKFGP
jgi:hypothetical protein